MLKTIRNWLFGRRKTVVYAPQELLVCCGRLEIIGPYVESKGGRCACVGYGTIIKMDGEEVKNVVRADLHISVDEVITLELEVLP